MNREEILKKAQAEGEDERAIRIRDQSMRWTYLVMVLTAAVFAFIRGQQGYPMMDLCATVCLSVTAGQLYRFIKTRERFCLVLCAVSLIVGAAAIVRFCMGH